MPEPSAPRPSSTVILLRETPGAPEPFSVLMLERHGGVAFPGVHAFPGGVVEPGDQAAHGASLPPGQAWAAPGEGDRPETALPFWIAAVREVFEEVGILLAHRAGRPLTGPLGPELLALRERPHRDESFAARLAEHGLAPDAERLHYFARWITPPQNPRRFDTRFLVARAPAGQEPVVDGTETVSCRWLGPREALAAYERDDIRLVPPTVRSLDDLARFSSVEAVLADALGRVVRAVQPEMLTLEGAPALRYPDSRDVAGRPRTLVFREGRWRAAN